MTVRPNHSVQSTGFSDALLACRKAFVGVVFFSLCLNLLLLTIPLYMMQLFSRVMTSHSTETLLVLTGLAVFALIVFGVLEAARSRIMSGIGDWLDLRLARPVLESSIRQSARSGQPYGIQGLRDLATLRGFLSGPAMLPLLDTPWMPIFGALIFTLHPLLGWVAILGATVLIAIGCINEVLTRRPRLLVHTVSTESLAAAEAAVQNADSIDAMGMMPSLAGRWEKDHNRAINTQSGADNTTGISTSLSKMMRFCLQIAMLGTGAWLALRGEVTPGVMIAASILMTRALAPVEQTIGSYRSFIAATAAYRRLAQQLGAAPEHDKPMKLPVPRGRLSVEAVYYAHPGATEPSIRGVNLSLEPGEALGIMGPSGSGKTTLARLLIGNRAPAAGHVRLDGAEMSTWAADDRGQYVGYVPQTVSLFSGTVRQNIARMTDGTAETVLEAAKLAGIHELLLRLPQGYETQIQNGGDNLSGGERQRIALARALFGNPKFVVLDEPSASLDGAGEESLVQALESLRERKTTCVVISHRPSVLRQVDRILVLRDGRVASIGPRDEVLKNVTVANSSRKEVVAQGGHG